MIDAVTVVEALNRLLAHEHACAIRYATHAAFLAHADEGAASGLLAGIASDEVAHADQLRRRIYALGGIPTMVVRSDDRRPVESLQEVIRISEDEERLKVDEYSRVLLTISATDGKLLGTLSDILRQERGHLEVLGRMAPKN